MRKYVVLPSLMLALLVLYGCGAPAEVLAEEPPAAFSLPETEAAGTVSAPAIVTEGRIPEEDYVLPPFPGVVQDQPRYNMMRWVQGGVIQLLAEAPEADAAFYGLPLYANSSAQTALIR